MNTTRENNRQKILIVDDSELNRLILQDILSAEYDLLEAADGKQAVEVLEKFHTDIDLILLDIVMPGMDGFAVLEEMNQKHWIEEIPVIMISAETLSSSVVRAYDLGVSDFISRPFDADIVRKRVRNTIMLYAKQKKMMGMIMESVYEKEKQSGLMVSILSHIVEFRNGESGAHVLHIQRITELLLKHLSKKDKRYHFSAAEITMIGLASALHDIGKIAIPGEILNKPGRLTDEEFKVMKTHTLQGSSILQDLGELQKDEPLVHIAHQICRWHHERWDGKGYPDGLKGDEIPLHAQVVALADVYDALTSERVYKKAFTHETAVEMITEGKCGAFNPVLLESLKDIAPMLKEDLKDSSVKRFSHQDLDKIAAEALEKAESSTLKRTLQKLEDERRKNKFFASLFNDFLFEYTADPAVLTFLSENDAHSLGLEAITNNPQTNPQIERVFGKENWRSLSEKLRNSTIENPFVQQEVELEINGQKRPCHLVSRAVWSEDETPRYMGAVGRIAGAHRAPAAAGNSPALGEKPAILNHVK